VLGKIGKEKRDTVESLHEPGRLGPSVQAQLEHLVECTVLVLAMPPEAKSGRGMRENEGGSPVAKETLRSG
jgi:hypothetical protein